MTEYSVGLIMQHRGSFSLYFFICVMESTTATKLQGKQISKPKKNPSHKILHKATSLQTPWPPDQTNLILSWLFIA